MASAARPRAAHDHDHTHSHDGDGGHTHDHAHGPPPRAAADPPVALRAAAVAAAGLSGVLLLTLLRSREDMHPLRTPLDAYFDGPMSSLAPLSAALLCVAALAVARDRKSRPARRTPAEDAGISLLRLFAGSIALASFFRPDGHAWQASLHTLGAHGAAFCAVGAMYLLGTGDGDGRVAGFSWACAGLAAAGVAAGWGMGEWGAAQRAVLGTAVFWLMAVA